MDELSTVRRMLLRIGRGVPATAPLARSLTEWATLHADWLGLSGDIGWEALLALSARDAPAGPEPHVLQRVAVLAEMLSLAPFDRDLLMLVVACDRLPNVGAIAAMAGEHGVDLPSLLGTLAGADPQDAGRAVRRSIVVQLELVAFQARHRGAVEIELGWTLSRLLDRPIDGEQGMLETLIGTHQAARLDLIDFAHVGDADFLVRLLRGARDSHAAGINILIHGPPGTGKTELARTLAASAGVALHAVGEADEDGDEPSRWERVGALRLAQRILAHRPGTALLFDEVDSLLFDRSTAQHSWEVGQVNEMLTWLDHHPLPVIAATNHAHKLDPAALRRFVFKLDLLPLGRERAEQAFERFFGMKAPADLAALRNLTPGDFAVVARQLRCGGRLDADDLVARLGREANAKPAMGGRIGFDL